MKRLNIIGKYIDKFYAFYDGAKVWGCNVHADMDKMPYYDLWFDIHQKPSQYLLDNVPSEKLMLRDGKIFEIAKKMMQGEYLNNSMCYMLFYALLNGYEEVKFYGCTLDNTEQEIRQMHKEALNMVIMFCRGKGMKITSNRPELLINYERYATC